MHVRIIIVWRYMCVVTGNETDGSLESLHACNSALAHPDNLN